MPSSMTVARRALPIAEFLPAAARAIVDALAGATPDLTQVTVLLPSLHATGPMARELARASGAAALLLPRLGTLPDWAADVPVDAACVPDSRREAQLYEALSGHRWFPDADLWHVSAELAALCAELTEQRVALPATPDELVAQLEAAYQAKAGESMQFEARLVHEAWRALSAGDKEVDRVGRYHLQLARLAAAPPGPLVLVGIETLTPAEQAFVDAYAARADVLILEADSGDDPLAQLLHAAWPARDAEAEHLYTRARTFAQAHAASPLAGRLALCGAPSLELEARAADAKIRTWLLEGRQRIAVVAQDRLAARRLRALLERAEVLVEDETGWTLSTVAATTVIMRLFDCVAGDFYHQDLLDLLKSPLIFADLPAAGRKTAVFELERLARRHSVVSGLNAFRCLAHGEAEAAAPMLERLADAARALGGRPAPLGEWLDRLQHAFALLGIDRGLASDVAGQQVADVVTRLSRELADGGPRVAFGDFRRWLDRHLEAETFRDRDVTSPVVFTHLAATRLRAFDGVVMIGCDAAHLPARPEAGLFFNQAVRRELGLPTRADDLEQSRRDLIGLVARSREVFVTWQAQLRGEANLVSPAFELLEAFHQLAYGSGLRDADWLARVPLADVRAAGAALAVAQAEARTPAGTSAAAALALAPSGAPAPAAPALVPDSITVSAYGSLVACPYQFFARHMLKLNELDEVREDVEKRDYGEVVHEVLKRFHEQHPTVAGGDRETLTRELESISERVFEGLIRANYAANAWLITWKALIPAYLDWQARREDEGWRFAEAEVSRAADIDYPGGAVRLRGRLDRLDQRVGIEAFAVLDYKTAAARKLQQRVEAPDEDVQLTGYALLQEGVAEAAFVSLDKPAPKTVALPEAPQALAAAERDRLASLFQRLRAGAPLTAHGDDGTCAWCEMQPLCRKAYWVRETKE